MADSLKKVLVLGGGLAGLSTAFHLRKSRNFQAQVIEKSGSVGGTARSVKINGFTFDFTGHLLHLHFPYTKKLIQKLLKNNLYACTRNAAIYSYHTLTPYPFQVHTYGLPKKVVTECVQGFLRAAKNYSRDSQRPTSLPFDIWSQRTFGNGIHKHFMKPYNEKLWRVPLNEMTAEWCGMFVPQPKAEDVIQGSKGDTAKNFGYNVTFLYPKRGGIQVLPEAMAKNLSVKLNTACEKVQWKEKKVLLSDGTCLSYDALVSTMPLVELLKRMENLPEEISKFRQRMRWTSVLCVNLGVNRAAISDKSWIYFPEKKYIFYRVGFPMNFTPHAAPPGHSSMYVEISYPPAKQPNWKNPAFLKRIQSDLEECGLLNKKDKIVVKHFIPIPYAYVIYTPDRKKIVETILRFLQEQQLYSIGRYGEWKYSFMEEAILDGKKTAEKLMEAYG